MSRTVTLRLISENYKVMVYFDINLLTWILCIPRNYSWFKLKCKVNITEVGSQGTMNIFDMWQNWLGCHSALKMRLTFVHCSGQGHLKNYTRIFHQLSRHLTSTILISCMNLKTGTSQPDFTIKNYNLAPFKEIWN